MINPKVIEAQRAVDVVTSGKPYTRHRNFEDAYVKASAAPISLPSLYEFLSANPIKEGHTRSPVTELRSDVDGWDNIEQYQNWVVEVDKYDLNAMPKEEWQQKIEAELKPLDPIVTMKIFSGGKSVHSWVCSEQPVDKEVWIKTAVALSKLISSADTNVLFQPNRMVRFPYGVRSSGKEQTVLLLKTPIPFATIQAHLVLAGVWDDNASIQDLLPKKPNPQAAAEWVKDNPFQAGVRELILNSWQWSGGRSAAHYRNGDNPTALLDNEVCAFDFVTGEGLAWSSVAEQYVQTHPADLKFKTGFDALLQEDEQRRAEKLHQQQAGIESVRQMQMAHKVATLQIMVPPKKNPCEAVGNSEAYEALKGTPLQVGVDIMRQALIPSVPFEIVLPNWLVMVGANLVQRKDATVVPTFKTPTYPQQGRKLLKLMINTGGGQACNVYGLVIAPSGIGKDVGNILSDVAGERGLLLADDGSGEGVYDELILKPNGIFAIPEFEPYFDANSYQHRVLNVLTKMFSRGFFSVVLSRRSKGARRESDFAFPSFIASIQPHIYERTVTASVLEKGFLGRILTTVIEEKPATPPRPTTKVLDCQPIHDVLNRYQALEGIVTVPADYLETIRIEAHQFHSSSTRLVNEYGPRLAVMLACDTVLKTEHWERAEILCRYFLKHQKVAFDMIGGNGRGNRVEQQEYLQSRIKAVVGKLLGKTPPEFPTLNNILRYDRKLRGYTNSDREQAVDTLVSAGELVVQQDGKKTWYTLPAAA